MSDDAPPDVRPIALVQRKWNLYKSPKINYIHSVSLCASRLFVSQCRNELCGPGLLTAPGLLATLGSLYVFT